MQLYIYHDQARSFIYNSIYTKYYKGYILYTMWSIGIGWETFEILSNRLADFLPDVEAILHTSWLGAPAHRITLPHKFDGAAGIHKTVTFSTFVCFPLWLFFNWIFMFYFLLARYGVTRKLFIDRHCFDACYRHA